MPEKNEQYGIGSTLDRRGFIRAAGVAGLAFYGLGVSGCKTGFSRTAEIGARKPKNNSLKKGVYAARGGKDPQKLVIAAVAAAGGMKSLVSRGDVVVIKPNIAWDRTPELAANTNPFVVAALVKLALDAGAKEVKVFDRPCNPAKKTYSRSGIEKAARDAGAKVIHADDDRFVTVKIPGGRVLKEWQIMRDALEADVFINVPVVKHHGATGMTAGMKNLMGIAGGQRGAWHVGQLDQRIADVQTLIKPDLIVIDAFRMLMNHGPTGGSAEDVKMASTVAVSTNIVAADSYAAKIFGVSAPDIAHIKIGAEMGLGEIDLGKIKVQEESVS